MISAEQLGESDWEVQEGLGGRAGGQGPQGSGLTHLAGGDKSGLTVLSALATRAVQPAASPKVIQCRETCRLVSRGFLILPAPNFSLLPAHHPWISPLTRAFRTGEH